MHGGVGECARAAPQFLVKVFTASSQMEGQKGTSLSLSLSLSLAFLTYVCFFEVAMEKREREGEGIEKEREENTWKLMRASEL